MSNHSGHPSIQLPSQLQELFILLRLTSIWFCPDCLHFWVYPALILAYMGQAAYLSQHHMIASDYQIGFYVSVPGSYDF